MHAGIDLYLADASYTCAFVCILRWFRYTWSCLNCCPHPTTIPAHSHLRKYILWRCYVASTNHGSEHVVWSSFPSSISSCLSTVHLAIWIGDDGPGAEHYFRKKFFRWLIYFKHLAVSVVAQNSLMLSINSCLVWGFTTLLWYSLTSCQRFLIGFIWGDSGRIFHQLISLHSSHSFVCREVCFRSLSAMNWGSGKIWLMKGRRVFFRMST